MTPHRKHIDSFNERTAPMASTMTPDERAKALRAIWASTHRDFKGTFAGERTILIMRNGGTTLVRLHDLTDAEIAAQTRKV